jgi:hypothetical protein
MRLNDLLNMITLCTIITGIGIGLAAPAQAMGAFQDVGGTIITDPSCTSFSGPEALCAAVSTSGTLTVNRFDGTAWTGFQDLGGIVVRKPNCTYQGIRNAICAVIGTDSSVFVNHFDGFTWSGFKPIGGSSISDAACTGIRVTEFVHCAIIGADGALYVNTFNGVEWKGFRKLGGNYIFNPTCAEDHTFVGAFCAAVTTLGRLDGWKFTGAGGWSRMPQTVGANISADPSCTDIGHDGILCAVRAGSSLVVNRADNGFLWTFLTNLGGILTAAPSCTKGPPGANVTALCAVRGTNSGVFVRSLDGNIWSGFQAVSGVLMVGAPSCTSFGRAQTLCGVRSTNNHLFVSVGP